MDKRELFTQKVESICAIVEEYDIADALECITGAIAFTLIGRIKKEEDIKRAIKIVQVNTYNMTMDLLQNVLDYENNKKRSN